MTARSALTAFHAASMPNGGKQTATPRSVTLRGSRSYSVFNNAGHSASTASMGGSMVIMHHESAGPHGPCKHVELRQARRTNRTVVATAPAIRDGTYLATDGRLGGRPCR